MRAVLISGTIFVLLTAAGCADVSTDPTDVAENAAIYGNDDRTDYYAESDTSLRELTSGSIVALMSPDIIDTRDPDNIEFWARPLGEAYGLCSGERFTEQPAAAFCSGTLIDDDLVLTAGHCVTDQSDCNNTRLVFNYFMDSADELARVQAEDVFNCVELVTHELSSGRETLDYAILRIDRAATPDHSPAPVRTAAEPVSNGDALTIIGFGSGLPAKIDDGGAVVDNRSSVLDYFNGTTDSFGGNSGSGVFNRNNEVVGILVRGDTDYVENGSCTTVATYPNSGSNGGEAITYAFRAVQDLCNSGVPSMRLCGTAGSCGDGTCSVGETSDTCPADCQSAVCGDEICAPGEAPSCPSDCSVDPGNVPTAWSCDPTYYGTLDGCDCDCGVIDPDCSQPGQELYNCEDGQECSTAGVCVAEGQGGTPGAIPSAWDCPASYYATGDGCDCECGVYDPDCDGAGVEIQGCTPGEICGSDGQCISPTGVTSEDVPDGWICPPGYYGTVDGCDCDCGAYDPDCDDDTQLVYNCGFLGICGDDGLCEFGFDLGGDGDKDLCSVSIGVPRPGDQKTTWFAILALSLVATRFRNRPGESAA